MQSLNIDLNDLLKYSLECIYIHDLQGNFINANSAALDLVGYEKDDLISLNIASLMDRQERKKALKAIESIIKTGYQQTLTEYKLIHKNGSAVYVETKGTLIYRENKPYVILGIGRDITERKKTEAFVKRQEDELRMRAHQLEQTNTALSVLMKNREKDQVELEQKIMINIRELVYPYIEKLKNASLNAHQKIYLDLIESGLKEVTSPFSQTLKTRYLNFTPMEIRIANMIKEGKGSEEISRITNSSKRTVEFHRNNIRAKLGVRNKKINLRTYLLSLH